MVLTYTYHKTCNSKNCIVEGKVCLYEQIEDKNNADSLANIEEGMLERIKHNQDSGEADDIIDNMINSRQKQVRIFKRVMKGWKSTSNKQH